MGFGRGVCSMCNDRGRHSSSVWERRRKEHRSILSVRSLSWNLSPGLSALRLLIYQELGLPPCEEHYLHPSLRGIGTGDGKHWPLILSCSAQSVRGPSLQTLNSVQPCSQGRISFPAPTVLLPPATWRMASGTPKSVHISAHPSSSCSSRSLGYRTSARPTRQRSGPLVLIPYQARWLQMSGCDQGRCHLLGLLSPSETSLRDEASGPRSSISHPPHVLSQWLSLPWGTWPNICLDPIKGLWHQVTNQSQKERFEEHLHKKNSLRFERLLFAVGFRDSCTWYDYTICLYTYSDRPWESKRVQYGPAVPKYQL